MFQANYNIYIHIHTHNIYTYIYVLCAYIINIKDDSTNVIHYKFNLLSQIAFLDGKQFQWRVTALPEKESLS